MAQIRAQLGDERAAAWAETFAPPSDGALVAPTGGGSGGASDEPVEGTLGLLGEERAQAWRDLLNGGGSGGQAGAGADPSAQDGGSGSGLFTTLEDGSTVQRDSSMAQLGHEGAVLVVTPKLFSTNGDGTWKEATFHFYPAGFDPDPENLEAGRLGTLTQSQYHDLLANLGSSDPATREAAESEARALGFGDRFFGKETKSVELAYDGYEGKIYQRGDSYLFRPGGDVEREKSVSSDEMSSLVARL
jgi:hypothetical protein